MLGIRDIAIYLPEKRAYNKELMSQFEVDEAFLEKKIGVIERCIKGGDEDTSDMALRALEILIAQQGLSKDEIQLLIVVTQNPDFNLPHVSGLVHGKAKLSQDCAAFDISLGCSGYVYGLAVMQSFMTAQGLTVGVLITCDPYSKIIDQQDKNTVLLFGDAATATLIGPDPVFTCASFDFGSQGDITGSLMCRDGRLQMNGREVFNFAATIIPGHVDKLLVKAGYEKADIDAYIFHQGSQYILDTLTKRLGLNSDQVRKDIKNIGNTVSSSIPILLQKEINRHEIQDLVLCGFGVGLSWASCICQRKIS
jgi:3-oxoacyl-[acyl-carrier-protein] synthase-3